MLDVVVVFALVGLVVYATIRALSRPPLPELPASSAGTWRTAHYDVRGETKVVLQKVSPSGTKVIDEHLVESIRVDDPAYDEKFLAAMATARQRRAVFESEED